MIRGPVYYLWRVAPRSYYGIAFDPKRGYFEPAGQPLTVKVGALAFGVWCGARKQVRDAARRALGFSQVEFSERGPR